MSKANWLIAIDLDKTFLVDGVDYPNYSFIKSDLRYLNKLINQGHKIVFLTGRSWLTTKKFYDLIDIDFDLSNYNGNLIKNIKNKDYSEFRNTFNLDNINVILKDGKVKNYVYNVIFEYENYIKTTNLNDLALKDYERIGFEIKELNIKEEKEEPLAIQLRFKTSIVNKEEILNYLSGKYNYKFWIWNRMINNVFNLEINDLNVNKYSSVKHFAKYYDISLDNVISFGDNFNDYEMLINSSHGVLMKNGREELKTKIRNITSYDNNNSGVVRYLIDFFEL